MAAASLLALIDDIATLLDDVAILTKVAAKKTAGVLGDDLALNAQQVAGVQAERELPVVWAVAKGSLLNKAILVPLALAISQFLPWLVLPLLMVGGAFLCYEGVEKLAHRWLHRGEAAQHDEALMRAAGDASVDLVAFERDKIRGAVRTDFILSAEIITITLGAVAAASWTTQLTVLVAVALLMTVGVYGVVAGIVKLDDLGLYLVRRAESTAEGPGRDALQGAGEAILWLAPGLMKALSVLGTLAMFLVGGGILNHGLPAAHHAIETAVTWAAAAWPAGHLVVHALLPLGADLVGGLVAGAVVLLGVTGVQRLLRRRAA